MKNTSTSSSKSPVSHDPYATLPKIELHLHLDCSLSFDVVRLLDPTVTETEYRQSFVAPAKCTDLADFITRALKGIELMQTKERLRLVTLDLIRQLTADHVIFALPGIPFSSLPYQAR